MPYYPPSWVPELPYVPDDVSIPDFIFDDKYGRTPAHLSDSTFIDCFTGKSYTVQETRERLDYLARGLAKEFGWQPNKGIEWDKVAGLFSVNTIDYISVSWAIHKLGGVCTPANAAYSPQELEHQIQDSGAKYIFTCATLLDTTLKVAQKLNIPQKNIYLLELPLQVNNGQPTPSGYKTIDDLIKQGKTAPEIEPLRWKKGQGAKQVAYLCYSSGTSGLPKGVMIAHRNVIANTIQNALYDSVDRLAKEKQAGGKHVTKRVLGLLPFSHIYGLVLLCHLSLYRGDGIVVQPKFDLQQCVQAIQDHKINLLYLVPPIIIQFINNEPLLRKYDLSAVEHVFTGAAPLGPETSDALNKQYPSWAIRQGYGLTETSTVVSSSSPHDIWNGSVGSLLPGYEAKIMSAEGKELTEYDQQGELWAKGPSVTLGYLNREEATRETFVDGFMRTGDEGVFRKHPESGNEHLFIVDRIKELIKVKGNQVAPAELEAHLLACPRVSDCAVISIPDSDAGERPKAYIVRAESASQSLEESPAIVKREIMKWVEKDKARYKWLREVEFIDAIPKSPSGKILRRLLRDKDREGRKKPNKL